MSMPADKVQDRVQESQDLTKYEQEKARGLRRADGSLNLKTLKPIHMKMIELHLQGSKNGDICKALHKTPATISRWMSDPLVTNVLEDIYKQEDARLKALFPKVVDVIDDALDMQKHSIGVNLKAADKWLKVHKKYDQKDDPTHQTAEDIIQQVFAQMNISGDNVQVNFNSRKEEE